MNGKKWANSDGLENGLCIRGLLAPEQLEHATGLQRDSKKRLGEILLNCGYVTESDVTDCLAAQYYMQVSDLAKVRSKPDARLTYSRQLRTVSPRFACQG